MTKLLGSLAVATTSLALALTLALNTHVASASAENGNSPLFIEKNCSAYAGAPGGYCTIMSSNVPQIPAGSRVFYDQAYGIPNPVSGSPGMLDSNIVLYVGEYDFGVGRCTLAVDGAHGLCTISDGYGPLAGFHARIDVSPAGGPNYYWKGTYSFQPVPSE
jgi:hypothetical protein